MKLDEIISDNVQVELPEDDVNIVFSMNPLLNYLERRIARSNNKTVLEEYRNTISSYFPKGDFNIPINNTKDYEELYKVLYSLLTNPLSDEDTFRWGLSLPISSRIVFSTEAMQKIVASTTHKHLVGLEHFKSACTISQQEVRKLILYSFLVKKLYNVQIFNTSSLIFQTNEEGTEKYYNVNVNNDFVEVSYDGILPHIDLSLVGQDDISKEITLNWLEATIPLDKLKIIGFSCMEVTDVTEKIQKELLRTLLLTSNLGLDSQNKISKLVQKLSGCNSLDCLLLPILYINDRIVTEAWQAVSEKIQQLQEKYRINPEDFNTAINKYVNNPKLIFRENIEETKLQDDSLPLLTDSGIMQGLIVKPVFSKNNLTGIILIASDCRNVISKQILVYAEEAMSLIQSLFETTIGNYLSGIDKVIKSKFTSIQPSVEWKFNEVALQYLKDKQVDKHPSILPIKFRAIHPLYGAIDFRNSTIERNHAEKEDKINQLESLISTINQIKPIANIDLLGEWEFQALYWVETIKSGIDASQEFALNQFLENESLAMLHQLDDAHPDIHDTIQPYLSGIAPNGIFHKNSVELEKTFKILNANIASILDQMNDKLQEAYPCYFERYRTDGIEFNVYLGQSITPNKPFSRLYLKNAQLWQLNTMALIAKVTRESQDNLPRKILTTQLIFVHSNTITISFRLDERRFDVEGSYNIRYEVIKKRIDKALIKGTSERLTQPGKIAIVYFQKKDIEDYWSHIKYLQKKDILNQSIEDLELEEMQGVTGLKAIRLSISDYPILENSNPTHLLEDIAFQSKNITTPIQRS